MPTFAYKAFDPQGVKLESEIDADNVEDAKKLLKNKGLLIAEVKEAKHSENLMARLRAPKVSFSDLEFLTSELSILLSSGVKIDKGLGILAKGSKDGPSAFLIKSIQSNLKQGKSVADSFDTKEKLFDSLYLNLISIGEASGKLPEVFLGLSEDLKFRKELKAKITQALSYPSVIMFVCIVCILFVFNYIVPQMGSIFAETDDLPLYTAILLGASEWMIKYQIWLFLGLLSLGVFIYSNRDNTQWQTKMASWLLTVPVTANLIKQIERIRFNSAMSLMLESGLKVDTAVGHAANNTSNPVISQSLKTANDKIKKGAAVSVSLGETPIYPDFYISLLEVGEESGRLSEVFGEIAKRSKDDFEQWITKVTNVLEPLLILFMGGIVGSVVVTMLLSVVSVNDINL